MAYDFSAGEIFDMAQQLEKNGVAFYRKAAENVSDEKSKKLLINLSLMEDAHEKTFAKMKKELMESEKTSSVFDPQGESALYLKALVDTRVFFEKKIDVTSMLEILKDAIVAEKDSILFYLGMKDLVPEKMGKDRIENIINEEMKHITMLSHEISMIKTA